MKLFLVAACALAVPAPAIAAPYVFTALPAGFTASALNSVGQIAGAFRAPGGSAPLQPAIDDRGTITTPALPASFDTRLVGINDAGDLLGVQNLRYSAPFAIFSGVVTGVATPGDTSSGSNAYALNNRRQIVGSADTVTSGTVREVGYVSLGGGYAVLDKPGAFSTAATGINDAGEVVGRFADAATQYRDNGFLFASGVFTLLDRPGAASTSPVAINDAGEVAGTYTDAAGTRGFVEDAGLFTDLVGPDGAAFLPVGLNNLGQLVGTFDGTGTSYLATPEAVPEPPSAALLVAGLASLVLLRPRRRVR